MKVINDELKIVYKYKPINDFTYNLLLKNEFYYSLPKEFNDPFDSFYPTPNYSGNKEQWLNFLNKNPILLDDKNMILEFLENNNFDNGKLKELIKPKYRTNESIRFLTNCFSKNYNNILMWSHYSHNHTGICLGFRILRENNKNYLEMDEVLTPNHPQFNYAPIWKVNYGECPEPFNGLIELPEATMRFLLTKASYWKYEDEFRSILIFDQYNNKRIFKFKKNILSEIIFGLRVDSNHREKIINLVTEIYIKEGINVKFIQCKQSQTKYILEFENIN